MGKSAEEIRREIEHTRGNLGDTLEAISDRVSPKTMVSRVKSDVAHKVSPRRMLRRRTEGLRERLHLGGDVGPGPLASRSNGNGNGSVVVPVTQRTQEIGGRARSATGAVAQEARGLPERAGSVARDNPLAAGAVLFAAGVAVAAALTPTERERELAHRLKDKAEPLKQSAIEAGKAVADEIQPVAMQRLDRVRERATTAADRVKSEAEGSATEVKTKARSAKAEVKGKAKSAARQVKGTAARRPAATTGASRRNLKPASAPAARRARSTSPAAPRRKPARAR